MKWVLTRVTFLVPGLSHGTFEQLVFRVYQELAKELAMRRAHHPVRLWAFIPDIHFQTTSGLDRYKVFNAGRFAAFVDWFGGVEALRMVPAGTCVGWGESEFALYCLSSLSPGTPVGNPRQIPSYRYSKRYGPQPPCFARATRLHIQDEPLTLLVAGTASICGEDSLHESRVKEQTCETFRNLASVARSAFGPRSSRIANEDVLEVYRFLRVYYSNPADLETITSLVIGRFRHAEEIEFVQATLCRPELLVEIEGLAKAF